MTLSADQKNSVLDIIAGACRVARAVQRDLENLRQLTKDDRSPVTVADFAVQAIVALGLRDVLGPQLIVGEENADELRTPGPEQNPIRQAVLDAVRLVYPDLTLEEMLDAIDLCNHDATSSTYWTLDPIDGTKGFLRGQQYAIALGKIENGQVTFGVMGCPNLSTDQTRPLDQPDEHGVMYAATASGGTWEHLLDRLDSEPRRVRAGDIRPGQPIRTCGSVEKSHSKLSDTMRILEHLNEDSTPVRLDSQCKYAVVARNQADAYLRMPIGADYVEKIWDHAAGMLIATEAGAVVSDITGKPLDFTQGWRLETNRGVICAAEGLHSRIIEAIDALGIAPTAI
ncbi:MAG: 3'(2'),5'-bisphosphate nucleotidase [Planctomycetes bacterium]|nr:3'(2'),5'-bisphosphate nucleotidase [Planctomycetota bacterium]